jgi:hypothetical protein
MSERIFRVVSLGLFIIGFVVGLAASTQPTGVLRPLEDNQAQDQQQVAPAAKKQEQNKRMSLKKALTAPIATLIEDVRLADEVNALNEGRWNQDVHVNNQDGLARAQQIIEAQNPEDLLAATK